MVAPMRMTVPLLHVGEHRVLLGLVEAVDLVDEENGALARLLEEVAGLLPRSCGGRPRLRPRRSQEQSSPGLRWAMSRARVVLPQPRRPP